MSQTARSPRTASRSTVKTTTTAKAPKKPAKAKASAPLRPLKGGAPSATRPPVPLAQAEEKRTSTVVARGYTPLVDIPKLPPPPKLDLEVGDKAVHPSHGLGELIAIEHREIGGVKGEFYILRIPDNGMRVMVPKAAAQAAGLRAVMTAKEANKVLETMRAREVAIDLHPWSRRFRAYTEMIKSGSPHEIAKVLRDMYRLKFDKELSFGERRLLDQAKSLLMKELAAAKGMTEAALKAEVDEMFRA